MVKSGCKNAKLFLTEPYVWAKDSWMDIIGSFLHLQTDEFKVDGKYLKKKSSYSPGFINWMLSER